MNSLFFVVIFLKRTNVKKKKSAANIKTAKQERKDILPRNSVYLLGLMLCLPFLIPIHRLPIPSFYSEWVAIFTSLFAGLMLFFSKTEKTTTLEIPYAITIPLSLALIVSIQWLLGYFAYSSSAFVVIIFLVWSASIIQVTSHILELFPQEFILPRLAFFIFIGGLVNAIFGILQFLELNQFLNVAISESIPFSQAGVYGNLAQQNHFATYLSLSLASLLFLYKNHRISSKQTIFFSIILMIGLFLSGSRSAFLYYLCCGYFFFGLKAKNLNKPHLKRILFIFISVIAFISLLFFIASLFGLKFSQLHRYLYFSETVGTRSFLWGHAWIMFVNNPLLGVGWDAFAFQLIEQIGQSGNSNLWGVDQFAHNIFLQLLAGMGLFGFLSFMIPSTQFLWRQRSQPLCVNRQWWFCSLTILTIHSSLEQPLYYAYFLGFASFIVSCLETKHFTIKFNGVKSKLISLFFIFGIVISAKIWCDYKYIENNFFESKNQKININNEDIIDLQNWSFFSGLIESIRPDIFVPHQSKVEDKITLNLRLMHFAPLAETEFRHAALLAENGNITDAKKRFKTAALAYPDQLNLYKDRFKILAITEPEKYKEIAEYTEKFQSNKK